MGCVLVAEDDLEMRCLVVEALLRDGHTVIEAVNGGRLLCELVRVYVRQGSLSGIDVIVSDIRMPGCDGLELFERLAAAHMHVPFILMTAFGDDETRRRAESLGAVLFDKPLSLDALRSAVKSAAAHG